MRESGSSVARRNGIGGDIVSRAAQHALCVSVWLIFPFLRVSAIASLPVASLLSRALLHRSDYGVLNVMTLF